MVQPQPKPLIVQPLPKEDKPKQGCFVWAVSSFWRLAGGLILLFLVVAIWQRYAVPMLWPVAVVAPVAVPLAARLPAGDVLQIGTVMSDGTVLNLRFAVTGDSEGYTLIDADGDRLRCVTMPQGVADLAACKIFNAEAK